MKARAYLSSGNVFGYDFWQVHVYGKPAKNWEKERKKRGADSSSSWMGLEREGI